MNLSALKLVSSISERKLKELKTNLGTLPETNISPMKIPIFPCKYHQNGGFSMAMLVLGRVVVSNTFLFSTTKPGEMIQFDCCIFFQTGWFNHQPAINVE